jgi:aspartate aminotransferase/aminotransferase
MPTHWIAARTHDLQISGIRKVFELARTLRDPINLSIGQPDFDVPEPVKAAAIEAIQRGRNGYTVTQGIPELRERIHAMIQRRYAHTHRQVLITNGTSGGLVLALAATVNPGDEVVIFDPYFVLYPNAISLFGGKPVYVDTYPDFQVDMDKVRAALSSRTKAIIVCSPANPTGVLLSRDCLRELAYLARRRDILLISDEVYSGYCYDAPFTSPAEFNDNVLALDGFSKTYGMTGWRLGYAHGPRELIDEMAKLQQFTFVCAPSMVQYAGVAALDVDMSATLTAYRQKRDRLVAGLSGTFEVVPPGGAFYVFPEAPWGTASEFAAACVHQGLLVIPGCTFSRRDTHFRISYAVDDRTITRGLDALTRVAQAGPQASSF